jgi:ADP-heptose:LPS heptosyltransferase
MDTPRHILAIRFSALGDIAMTVPVVRNLLQQHPQLEISFISVPFVEPLFAGIDRLHFYGVDTREEYKGVAGIFRLSKKIKKEIPFDAIADLHNVLRTKLLRFFLAAPAAVIDKGRKEKKELTRPHHKNLHPLKTGFERYADVFASLGFPVSLNIQQGYFSPAANPSLLPFTKNDQSILIGLAPFAKHVSKMYPLQKMKKVVELLLQNENIQVLVFGTTAETTVINDWFDNKRIINMAARLGFADELNVIAQLHLMLSMDSANMHLASLVGVPVVSVWGGTHPWLGFYGWGQDPAWAVQTDLPCRPSSVFGNKPCPVHGEAGCMQEISPQMLAEKVSEVLAFTAC